MYIAMGFIAFIWNAKLTYRTEFDSQAFGELLFFIVVAPLAFLLVTSIFVYDKFFNFMNNLLKKINK